MVCIFSANNFSDIVIAILSLSNHFNKILYIDIDVHHGDGTSISHVIIIQTGVENAFRFSDRVFTLSFHKFERGFFPGTGSLHGKAKGNLAYSRSKNSESQSCLNVPLHDGIDDATYIPLFKAIVGQVMQYFKPSALVFQCGADGTNYKPIFLAIALAGDPLGGFNLTHKSYGECLKTLKEHNIPMLVLGGGGYNHINTAKCWAYLTRFFVNWNMNDLSVFWLAKNSQMKFQNMTTL